MEDVIPKSPFVNESKFVGQTTRGLVGVEDSSRDFVNRQVVESVINHQPAGFGG
jgi:hypothetical protein